jgi:ATP-dependent RNA helicase SUPV3L1/SUV3
MMPRPPSAYRPQLQPLAVAPRPHGGRLRVVLGPTNTGKTHLAIERMLAHSSGIIGLPLRLLAREVYERLVKVKGRALVALVTGEERIQPPHAAYFVCTVEAMPLEREAAFLAVDEIQLAADAERGHVFTDRLLRARGRDETMFMGAAAMRPALELLLPDAEFETRDRFSRLSYAGMRKLSRLPRRAAVVAFSANEVYALAELLRRHKGGAAVVMGALSPRTRNAQVALFENGDVDYLVATDAIGMGLNLNINHVAFGGLMKFDGQRHRMLTPSEGGQIAGRAGRHLTDGSFGTLAEAGEMPLEMIEAIEDHRFPAIEQLQWRSAQVDYSSLEHLIASLERPAATPGLVLAREAPDLAVLRRLAGDEKIRALAAGPAAVGLLWQVCRLPDFAKVMPDIHARLVARIYGHLMDHDGLLPDDWMAAQVAPLDRTQGDIDSLAARLAHIRTWTYVAHRGSWLNDPGYWQGHTRAIEDRLSDALHERLAQRFVDRRSAILTRSLKRAGPMLSGVGRDGAVTVEGEYVGALKGFRFEVDELAAGDDRTLVMKAAREALKTELPRRVRALTAAGDDAFSLDDRTGHIRFAGEAVARLTAGAHWSRPGIALERHDITEPAQRTGVEERLKAWVSAHLEGVLAPILPLRAIGSGEAAASGPVRAVVFRLHEDGGALPRASVAAHLKALTKADRQQFKALGVRLGPQDVFLPRMLKPGPARLKALLWRLATGAATPDVAAGRVSLAAPDGFSEAGWRWAGYRLMAGHAIRIDALDRLVTDLIRREQDGFIVAGPELAATLGLKAEAFGAVMAALGYQGAEREVTGFERAPRKAPRRRPRHEATPSGACENRPLAILADLQKQARKGARS